MRGRVVMRIQLLQRHRAGGKRHEQLRHAAKNFPQPQIQRPIIAAPNDSGFDDRQTFPPRIQYGVTRDIEPRIDAQYAEAGGCRL